MEALRKYWKLILSVIGSIIGLVLFKDFFQKDLKAELKNADASKQDALLEQEKSRSKEEASKLDKDNAALRGDLKDPPKDMSPDEVEDYWKKN